MSDINYIAAGLTITAVTAVIILFIIVIILVLTRKGSSGSPHGRPNSTTFESFPPFTPAHKLAGMRGEEIAKRVIGTVLREDDILLNNVSIEYDGNPAELDNVIVNKYGVFIIEVKNYSGKIVGSADDFEWLKYKTTDAGNIYEKSVKNPIKQVKRQIHILAKYLDYYGISVWVRGYAILLHDNSPVDSEYILTSIEEIDRKVHTADRRMLNSKTVTSIKSLLE